MRWILGLNRQTPIYIVKKKKKVQIESKKRTKKKDEMKKKALDEKMLIGKKSEVGIENIM